MSSVLLSLVATACSKGDDGGIQGVGSGGTIYTYFAGDISSINLNNGNVTKIHDSGRGSWLNGLNDVSLDGQTYVFSVETNPARVGIDRIVFKSTSYTSLNNREDFDTNNEFDYEYEPYGVEIPHFLVSPDKKYVAAFPAVSSSSSPIDIVEVASKTERPLAVGSGSLSDDNATFVANGDLYFLRGRSLYKSSSPYTSASKIFDFYEDVTDLTINPQATKMVARRTDKHLWLMNLDGTGLTQLTTSQTPGYSRAEGEFRPTFSPDGNYIAFQGLSQLGMPLSYHDPNGDWWTSAVGGGYGYLAIIPIDGKTYNLDDQNSGVIWVTNGNDQIPTSNRIFWR
ncbi:MAG: hypothetical protein Q4C98_08685 [Capnocytophaga sp.]|nr:hypothetical protein [Capnocytophaga sp.]